MDPEGQTVPQNSDSPARAERSEHGRAVAPAESRAHQSHSAPGTHTPDGKPAGGQDSPDHGTHWSHDKHAEHSVAMFRDKFWLSLLLTLPTLVWGQMLQRVLRHEAPTFPGAEYTPALFGTTIYLTTLDEHEQVTTVPLAQLREDDVVLVRPGTSVPADGEVHEGRSTVNESMVTGESRPSRSILETA